MSNYEITHKELHEKTEMISGLFKLGRVISARSYLKHFENSVYKVFEFKTEDKEEYKFYELISYN